MSNVIELKKLFGFWQYEQKTGNLWLSNSIKQMFSLPRQAFWCAPESIAKYFNLQSHSKFLAELQQALSAPHCFTMQVSVLTANAHKQDLDIFIESLLDEQGEVTIKGMLGESHRSHNDKRTNLQSRIVFDNTSEGILITDEQGNILNVNDGFCQITGYSKEEVIGQKPSILKSGLQGKAFYSHLWAELKTTGKWRGELWNKRKNQQLFASFQNITLIPNQAPGEAHFVSIFSDVSKEYENKRRLDELAFKDQLTGLSNRTHFEAMIQRQIAGSPDIPFYLLFLDLNNFKSINDNYGHAYGDVLLQMVAAKLSATLEGKGLLARFGGDEFTVLLHAHVSNELELAELTASIRALLNAPFTIENEQHSVNVSIGAARYPCDGQSAEALLKSADTAMYDAKYSKQLISLFHPDMGHKVRRKSRLAQDLLQGLQLGQFYLQYQPKIHIQSGKISGYEALCRWQHPDYGAIAPPEFIAIAEEYALYQALGDWVIDTALLQFQPILQAKPQLNLSINVSASQILQADFGKTLVQKIHAANIACQAIELEITETELIQDMEKTVGVLKQLRELGVAISIDDFGKGYSSFYYLRNLPVDRIKLDKDCIRDAVADERTSACIISAINTVARQLKLDLIVEGVETELQDALLKRIGVPHAQGFHYAYPQSLDKCLQLYAGETAKLDAS